MEPMQDLNCIKSEDGKPDVSPSNIMKNNIRENIEDVKAQVERAAFDL